MKSLLLKPPKRFAPVRLNLPRKYDPTKRPNRNREIYRAFVGGERTADIAREHQICEARVNQLVRQEHARRGYANDPIKARRAGKL